MLGILHTPLWIIYLIATNSDEHLRGRREGNFRKQINKAVISHSPYATAKIPGTNCFSGKLATYVNPSEKLLAGLQDLVDGMTGRPAAFRENNSPGSLQVKSFSTDCSTSQHPVLFFATITKVLQQTLQINDGSLYQGSQRPELRWTTDAFLLRAKQVFSSK